MFALPLPKIPRTHAALAYSDDLVMCRRVPLQIEVNAFLCHRRATRLRFMAVDGSQQAASKVIEETMARLKGTSSAF